MPVSKDKLYNNCYKELCSILDDSVYLMSVQGVRKSYVKNSLTQTLQQVVSRAITTKYYNASIKGAHNSLRFLVSLRI